MKRITPFVLVSSILLFLSCSKDDNTQKIVSIIPEELVYNDGGVDSGLKMNQLQYLSSHNSYRKHTDKTIYNFVKSFAGILPYNLTEWEYDHVDIYTQLEKYGVRHLELDIYGDKEGGRFYNRAGYKLTGRDESSNIDALKQPGLKVMHIPDVDCETNYYTFIEALKDIKRWSNDYPDHLPLYVMIEPKTETVGDVLSFLGFVKAEPWDDENIASIEQEILQVFPREQIIAPDDIRRNRSTLRQAVLEDGWLTIGEARGKIMFMFDNDEVGNKYRGNQKALEGKLIFTNSTEEDADAAYIQVNDPFDPTIPALVKKGFMVRSMIGGVKEAQTGDYSKWEAGKAAGSHFLSTDYYKADERAGIVPGWTDFHVGLANHSYRINPVAK
ncbi:MAG TPA: Ca2+-dependent phosphoinositide-specific phospholipase C [Chitinophagales bacterium]|nr:Ca2+-dependent phosphoinositide-specific phospholipase C [Chitinophagales bacterium]